MLYRTRNDSSVKLSTTQHSTFRRLCFFFFAVSSYIRTKIFFAVISILSRSYDSNNVLCRLYCFSFMQALHHIGVCRLPSIFVFVFAYCTEESCWAIKPRDSILSSFHSRFEIWLNALVWSDVVELDIGDI